MSVSQLLEILFAVLQVLALVWPVWLLLALITIIRFVAKFYMFSRFRKVGMDKIDVFTGEEFEKHLTLLFECLEYQVERTPLQGDFGADLILQQEDERTAVQAKRSSSKVGISAVQQVVAAKGFYQCNKAIVVTNNYFTHQAKRLAKANNVLLWDRKKLTSVLLSVESTTHTNKLEPALPLSDNSQTNLPIRKNICQKCGKTVSAGVQRYCEDQPQLFDGRIYCMKCQPAIKNSKLAMAA